MSLVKIIDIATPGTKEYLLMSLACEAHQHSNEISTEELEQYLDENPDEAEFFDPETISLVKRRIQSNEQLRYRVQVRKLLDHDIHRKLNA